MFGITPPNYSEIFVTDTKKTLLLCPEQYQPWFDALRTNNINKVEDYLQNASPREDYRLLHGTFDFPNPMCRLRSSCKNLQLTKPLFVAAGYGSIKVLRFLIKSGIDILQTDLNGWNIFHSLVAVSFYEPCAEERACFVYKELLQHLSEVQVKTYMTIYIPTNVIQTRDTMELYPAHT